MKFSSDTGEPILSDIDRNNADIACDAIIMILGLKDDIDALFEKISRLRKNHTLTMITDADISHCYASIQEDLDGILSPDYCQLIKKSYSVEFPEMLCDYKQKEREVLAKKLVLSLEKFGVDSHILKLVEE